MINVDARMRVYGGVEISRAQVGGGVEDRMENGDAEAEERTMWRGGLERWKEPQIK